jgi:hypothetical protein
MVASSPSSSLTVGFQSRAGRRQADIGPSSPLGQFGETDELARGEHTVLAQQPE